MEMANLTGKKVQPPARQLLLAEGKARVVRMPSAVVAAASVVKAGKTAVVGTAAEVNKPHLK